MLSKTAIYIPSYNAALTLPKVLDRIPIILREGVAEILVVDNHSHDETQKVAQEYKDKKGFRNLEVIRNSTNLGYGGSQKLAYKHCIDKGYHYVAMLHGDAQYAPEFLESLLIPTFKKEYDMIFGSRMKGDPIAGGMPLYRFLGNKFLTVIQNLFLGTHLSEFHSGYRVYSVSALKAIPFERLSSDYHFDTEIIILFKQNGLRIGESPIPTHYGDEKNYVNVWKYGIDVLVTTLTYFLHIKGLRRSRRWFKILGV